MPHNALDKKSNFEFLEYVDNIFNYAGWCFKKFLISCNDLCLIDFFFSNMQLCLHKQTRYFKCV